MQILVMSDIHANLEALEAVLDAAPAWSELWFLGDAVGYGPEPVACVERLLELEPHHWLAGNHDWAALGRLDTAEFNAEARRAAEWTGERIQGHVRQALERLEPQASAVEHDVQLVHASPRRPIWEYILNAQVAEANFEAFDHSLCLFGHTHVPAIYEEGLDGAVRVPFPNGEPCQPHEGVRWMVNPGGVGQPRDGDPRAAFAMLDPATRELTLHRVEYDFELTQRKIVDAGLPPRLAARLQYGW